MKISVEVKQTNFVLITLFFQILFHSTMFTSFKEIEIIKLRFTVYGFHALVARQQNDYLPFENTLEKNISYFLLTIVKQANHFVLPNGLY